MKKRLLLNLLIVPLALSAGALTAIYSSDGGVPEGVSATVFPEALSLPQFALRDHKGNAFTNDSLRGGWSFLFFGFTHCPDICPATLNTLEQVRESLLDNQPAASVPEIVFVSVDPQRDTQEALADYLGYFNPEFIGVTGNPENIRELSAALNLSFGVEGELDSGDYQVFHSARIVLVDPQARVKALFSTPHTVGGIVADYTKILDS